MDNQHQKIKGYRDLSQEEIDLMNEIKAKGAELGVLVDRVYDYISTQGRAARLAVGVAADAQDELARLQQADPATWAVIGRTHFQQGLMALTRAVAQPTNF